MIPINVLLFMFNKILMYLKILNGKVVFMGETMFNRIDTVLSYMTVSDKSTVLDSLCNTPCNYIHTSQMESFYLYTLYLQPLVNSSCYISNAITRYEQTITL